ncbi:hypothetical protein D3C78_732870 [compost metagenome]
MGRSPCTTVPGLDIIAVAVEVIGTVSIPKMRAKKVFTGPPFRPVSFLIVTCTAGKSDAPGIGCTPLEGFVTSQ